jgi:peptidoglycan/LPS O-acetylase OafA/YrhL
VVKNVSNRLLELDSLRGIAAVFVLLHHYTFARPEAKYGFQYGVTGVDLFFIISGFVIFLSLNKISSWKQFVVNRLVRLYPAYWVCVSFTASIMLFFYFFKNGSFDKWDYLADLTMVQHYFRDNNIDGSYWTLTIELLFYITILLVFILKKINRIDLICSFFLIGITLNELLVKKHFPSIFNQIGTIYPLVFSFPLFFAGIYFYKLKFENNSWRNYFFIFGSYIVACLVYNQEAASKCFITTEVYSLILGVYFLAFILYINDKLKFIVNKITLFFGTISYPLYLIHLTFSVLYVIPLLMKNWHVSFLWSSVIAFSLCVSLATLVTFYVEKPLIYYFKKQYK